MPGQPDVVATLNGFIRSDVRPEGRLPIHLTGPGDGPMPFAAAPPIAIRDARPMLAGTTEAEHFHDHGFVLLPHTSAVADWDADAMTTPPEQNDIARLYLPEVEAMIRKRLLPGRDLNIMQTAGLLRRGPGTPSPFYAQGVHGDHGLTADDYQESLEAFSSPEVGAMWRKGYDRPQVAGFMVINFWRPVYQQGPLRHLPLAICHPDSVAEGDVVPASLLDFTPTGKPTNQLSLRHNEAHRWFFYPGMTNDEVLVFKIFETFKDGRRPGLRSCFHTAFTDPAAPEDAPKRQSCEHRVGVFILED
ncbi:MAG: hypothetical protein EON88_22525 [Brevundimonas sp.]|nr:MAG: hypothetical protein EON88_22525 [Brevundimonas sp.]